jgi:hypothetical protein
MSLFILLPLFRDETGDVDWARSLNRFPDAMEITQELIHCGYGHWYEARAVATLLEVLFEPAHER